MIEVIVSNYLEAELGIGVYMEEQNRKELPYVVIEKTSGGSSNHIQTATLAIQSYDESMYKAACLNEKVKEIMENITSLNEISSATLNSDYNYTDTERKRYRYQAVYDFVYF